jgi:hypothetical protein
MLGCGDGWIFTGGWISKAACAVMVATKSGPAVGTIPPGTLHARMINIVEIESRHLFDFNIFSPVCILLANYGLIVTDPL